MKKTCKRCGEEFGQDTDMRVSDNPGSIERYLRALGDYCRKCWGVQAAEEDLQNGESRNLARCDAGFRAGYLGVMQETDDRFFN